MIGDHAEPQREFHDSAAAGAAAMLSRLLLQASRLRGERFARLVEDELPWRMLLGLYPSPEGLGIEALLRRIGVHDAYPVRWLHYLHDSGLIEWNRNPGGRPGAALSQEARARLTECLADCVLSAGNL